MLLPITLTFAAACALLNLWLAIRCARFRIRDKILHGDAGHGLLARRMRAHANFIEYTPIVLILFGLIEMAITLFIAPGVVHQQRHLMGGTRRPGFANALR